MTSVAHLADMVKTFAIEAGFSRVGFASAEPMDDEWFEDWLARGCHGEMAYLSRHIAKRFDPTLLVPASRSVICLAVPYAPQSPPKNTLVARYAHGRDYHRILKKRCHRLMDHLRERVPNFSGRAFVDSAPVMERALAARAGLGWIGRHGCLIVPGLGSYVFLCEIICNLSLPASVPLASACFDCDACVKACPTAALTDGPRMDARRCISYLTLEHRGMIAPSLWPRMGGRLIGCDACQAACPHNCNLPAGDSALLGEAPLGGADLAAILAWRWEDWDAATRGSACRRASYEMLLRNAIIAAGNSGDRSLREALERIRQDHPDLSELVSWALERLGRSF